MELEKEIKQQHFADIYQKMTLNVIFTSGWLENLHATQLKPYGITPQQFNILRILRGQHPKPASVNLLIDRMLDKMSNASRLVEKLRIKEYVSRQACPMDRRQVDVLITEKGLKLLKELDEKFSTESFPYFKNLTEEEAAQISDLLDKFRG